MSLVAMFSPAAPGHAQQDAGELIHNVQPGDTWAALAWRYNVTQTALRVANPHPNRQWQPAIGSAIRIPGPVEQERTGYIRSRLGGLIQLAAETGANPWQAAILNGARSPYHPLLYKPIFLPGGEDPPRQFPGALQSLEVSRPAAQPGQALGVRGLSAGHLPVIVRFAHESMNTFQNGPRFVALTGTGAFLEPGQYPLEFQIQGQPLWTQPWLIEPGEWTFEQINYTGAAAAIDAEAIRQERERLASIWNQAGPQPLWTGPFVLPLTEYLGISSQYGARRSYGGGPYDRYHEGLDFSAFGGTEVTAPASGVVVIAEDLVARGGAVILDHGVGIFTGYYHLSEVLVEAGQQVSVGQAIGKVGSTGLSTGNHLHWDMLVAGTWVSPAAWLEQDMACWLLAGWGTPCPDAELTG